MKYKWVAILAAGTFIHSLAMAQQETAENTDPAAPPPMVPIPPKVPGEEIEPSKVEIHAALKVAPTIFIFERLNPILPILNTKTDNVLLFT